MKIDHPQDTNCTTETIQADIDAAKKTYTSNDFCFTWATVQALLDKIEDMQYEAMEQGNR